MTGILHQSQISSHLAKADPRCKLIALFICSVCLLCIDTWIGLGLAAGFLIVGLAAGCIRPRVILTLSIPLLVILLIIWLCNAFVYDPASAQTSAQGIQAGQTPMLPIQFSVSGAWQGALYALRIWFLFVATFIVVLTTSYESILLAVASLLSPLRVLKFPVDDAAMIATLALRFIPLVAEQASAIKRAQLSRAAQFEAGSVWQKVMAWVHVFIPLFVMLFRQADRMALAMEARCYGAYTKRTSLNQLTLRPVQVLMTVALCLVFIVLAVCF